MNLAPLLAELAGLKALPMSLLRPDQLRRLEGLRASLALAQHVFPAQDPELPYLRLATADGACEGPIVGHGRNTVLVRLAENQTPRAQGPSLLMFADGKDPLALICQVRPGPSEGYWQVETGEEIAAVLEVPREAQTRFSGISAVLMPA